MPVPAARESNNADRLTQITQGTATAAFAYDAAGRRTQLTLPNGITTDYSYDAASRLTGLTYKNGPATLGTLTYSYDANTQRRRLGGTWARTGLPQPVASATYNAANQQVTFAGQALTYDLNGNLASDGTNTYAWNARNQLTSITGPTAGSFVYDGLGRRLRKTIGGTSTDFLYDGLNAVQEQSGASLANLLTGLGFDEMLTRTDAAGTRAFLTDALGSALALADSAATLETEYSYEPFGATTSTGASTSNSFDYTARESDGTGLKYYRARYYHPRLQRFISEDPIGFTGGDFNLYAYVANQPTDLADPLGLEPVTISTAAAVATVCAAGAIAGDLVVLAVSGRKTTWGELAAGAGIGCAGGVAVLGAYAMAAGGAAANAAETGAQFLAQSWHKATFFSTSGSVAYHWLNHAQRYGKSAVQYTQDALDFFSKNQHLAKAVRLKDGTPGVRIRTEGPGGYFTPDGRVVSFWYK